MMGTAGRVAALGAKVLAALAVLALGLIVIAPRATAAWPLASGVQAMITRAVAATPVERGPWGVVLLLLGFALFLAAWPKPVADPPRLRALTPVEGATAPVVEDIPAIEPVLPEASEAAEEARAEPVVAPVEPPVEPRLAGLEAPSELSPCGESESPPHDELLVNARQALMSDASVVARSHLADLLKKSGDIHDAEGRLPDAIAAYEESAGLRRTIALAKPDDGRQQRWLWVTLEALAECVDARGRRGRAAELYREALAAGGRAVALTPEESAYGAELTDTRNRLAALDAQLAL